MALLKIRRIAAAPIEIFEFAGAKGDYIVTGTPLQMRVEQMAASLIFVKGQITVTRTKGTPPAGGLGYCIRNAGDTSFNEGQLGVEPGQFRKVVTSEDPALYYCCTHVDHRPLEREAVRLEAGRRRTLRKGDLFFLALGSAKLAGRAFTAPTLIHAESGDVELVAGELVLGLVFRGWQ